MLWETIKGSLQNSQICCWLVIFLLIGVSEPFDVHVINCATHFIYLFKHSGPCEVGSTFSEGFWKGTQGYRVEEISAALSERREWFLRQNYNNWWNVDVVLWSWDESAVWNRSTSSPPEKACVTKSGGKHMFILFCDRRGMILQHAVPKDTTVNAAYYSKVICFTQTHI